MAGGGGWTWECFKKSLEEAFRALRSRRVTREPRGLRPPGAADKGPASAASFPCHGCSFLTISGEESAAACARHRGRAGCELNSQNGQNFHWATAASGSGNPLRFPTPASALAREEPDRHLRQLQECPLHRIRLPCLCRRAQQVLQSCPLLHTRFGTRNRQPCPARGAEPRLPPAPVRGWSSGCTAL